MSDFHAADLNFSLTAFSCCWKLFTHNFQFQFNSTLLKRNLLPFINVYKCLFSFKDNFTSLLCTKPHYHFDFHSSLFSFSLSYTCYTFEVISNIIFRKFNVGKQFNSFVSIICYYELIVFLFFFNIISTSTFNFYL